MNGASCWGLAGFSPLPPRPLQVYTTKTAAEISFSLDDYGGGPVTSKKNVEKKKARLLLLSPSVWWENAATSHWPQRRESVRDVISIRKGKSRCACTAQSSRFAMKNCQKEKKEMKSPSFDSTNQLCASAASFGSDNARFLTNVFFFYCLVNRYTIKRRRTPASIQSVVICWPPKSPRSKITASPPSECPVPLRLW